MRALVVIRLSRATDTTTSPERQLQTYRELRTQRGYEVVGVAEDLDVSGAVDPFDREKRPNLSRWLAASTQTTPATLCRSMSSPRSGWTGCPDLSDTYGQLVDGAEDND
jgi:hypothetical protein